MTAIVEASHAYAKHTWRRIPVGRTREAIYESLVANQESAKKLELDSVSGNVAGFVMYVKETGAANLNDGNNQYVSLGSTGSLDLLDSGSQSLWGNNVGLPAE